jgi:hypothetical protein
MKYIIDGVHSNSKLKRLDYVSPDDESHHRLAILSSTTIQNGQNKNVIGMWWFLPRDMAMA